MHYLNAKTCQDAYPIPRIEEAFDVVRRVSFLSSLDLSKILEIFINMFGDGESAYEVHIVFYSYEQLEGNNMDDVSLKLVELVDRGCQFDATKMATLGGL